MRTYRGLCRIVIAVCIGLMLLLDVLVYLNALRAAPHQEVRPVHVGPLYATDLWLYVGPVQLQPSELSKLGLVLWGADVLVRKGRRIA